MKILKAEKFNEELREILYFIAKDSKVNAKSFKNRLIEKIQSLSFMPYKFRKSIYFESDDIRDLVFKEYVIPYKIDTVENQIIIIGINKYQKNL